MRYVCCVRSKEFKYCSRYYLARDKDDAVQMLYNALLTGTDLGLIHGVHTGDLELVFICLVENTQCKDIELASITLRDEPLLSRFVESVMKKPEENKTNEV